MVSAMKFGIRWYVGVGEHDYEESGFVEYATMREVFGRLMKEVPDDEHLFDTLDGRQDDVYWITDGYGFELYRVS